MGSIFDIDDTNSINSINLIEDGWRIVDGSPGNFVKQIPIMRELYMAEICINIMNSHSFILQKLNQFHF